MSAPTTLINRRKFLTSAFAATAGGILIAEDLLSTKSFFLPPRGGWIKGGWVHFEVGNESWTYTDKELKEFYETMSKYSGISVEYANENWNNK